MKWLDRFRQWLHGPDTKWGPTGITVKHGEPYSYEQAIRAKVQAEERIRLRRKLEAARGRKDGSNVVPMRRPS